MSRPHYRRSLRQRLGALVHPMHYRSLARVGTYAHPVTDFVKRYLFDAGDYPAVVRVKDPQGRMCDIEVRSRFDVLTVHEIFVWRCYPATGAERTIVDLGANIGVSMAYFLATCPEAVVYGVEPLHENLTLARRNIAAHEHRTELIEAAVMDYAGTTTFGVEPTGRYSGVGLDLAEERTVRCVDVQDLVQRVLDEHGSIDLLKVDIEGAEDTVLRGIDDAALDQIGMIAVEGTAVPHDHLMERGFSHKLHASGVHWYHR